MCSRHAANRQRIVDLGVGDVTAMLNALDKQLEESVAALLHSYRTVLQALPVYVHG
jgi:hypothetical protein